MVESAVLSSIEPEIRSLPAQTKVVTVQEHMLGVVVLKNVGGLILINTISFVLVAGVYCVGRPYPNRKIFRTMATV